MSRYNEGAPAIGKHRTVQDVAEEMDRMGYIPDSPVPSSVIQEAQRNISLDIVSHAIVSAQRFGYSDYNEYLDRALTYFDETSTMQQVM